MTDSSREMALSGDSSRASRRLPPMPIPHEHGAWAWLYAPLVIGLAAAWPGALLPSILLLVAVTGAFFTQNSAMSLLRGRAPAGTWVWVTLHAALLLAGGVPLVLVFGHLELLALGLLGGLFFLVYLRLVSRPELRRRARSEQMEILTIATLALSAPAACIVAGGRGTSLAWTLWVACALYFCSSIFYVKMWLTAAKHKKNFDAAVRQQAGAGTVRYHLLLAALVIAAGLIAGGAPGLLIVIAYSPILVRALFGRLNLSPEMPSLRRLGMYEMVYTLWFAGFIVAATRGLAS